MKDGDVKWKGLGLPPVGEECKDDAGNEVVIVAHHIDGKHAIFAESKDSNLLYQGLAGDFKVISSDEEKSSIEREAEINNMVKLIAKGSNQRVGFTAASICSKILYDEGYNSKFNKNKDSQRLEWLIEEGCVIQYQNGNTSDTVYRVYWPSLSEQQPEWHSSPREAIDVAMKIYP